MKNAALLIALCAILVTGVVVSANNQQAEPASDNPLDGKVVVINPSSISTHRKNARIEYLAGKAYVVYEVKPGAGNLYDYWIAVDEISRMRVFDNMKDAQAALDRKKVK